MKRVISTSFVLYFICGIHNLYGNGSIVYNLRVAETTKKSSFVQNVMKPSAAVVTLFDQIRKRTFNDFYENIGGGLFSLVYFPKNFYMKMDCAVGHVEQKSRIFHDSITQTDDLLFSTGYGFDATKKTKMTLSGFFGIPTHKDNGFGHAQFGTGHIGLGMQADGSYRYVSKLSLRFAARLVHFFSRNVTIEINNQERHFKFTLGNLTDVLIAHHCNFGRHRFELGYNASFLNNAHIEPNLANVISQTNFIRNSFYASYVFGFLFRRHVSGIIVGFSYGYDRSPKIFGYKQLMTIWGSWGINF
jgi:hypothetical protein